MVTGSCPPCCPTVLRSPGENVEKVTVAVSQNNSPRGCFEQTQAVAATLPFGCKEGGRLLVKPRRMKPASTVAGITEVSPFTFCAQFTLVEGLEVGRVPPRHLGVPLFGPRQCWRQIGAMSPCLLIHLGFAVLGRSPQCPHILFQARCDVRRRLRGCYPHQRSPAGRWGSPVGHRRSASAVQTEGLILGFSARHITPQAGVEVRPPLWRRIHCLRVVLGHLWCGQRGSRIPQDGTSLSFSLSLPGWRD